MGVKAAGGGIVVVLIGAMLYNHTESTTILGIDVLTEYPYRDLGMVVIILGFIITAIGVLLATAPTPSTPPPHQSIQFYQSPPTPPYHQQPIEKATQPSDRKFCRHCGRRNEMDSRFCTGCGTRCSGEAEDASSGVNDIME